MQVMYEYSNLIRLISSAALAAVGLVTNGSKQVVTGGENGLYS